MFKLKGRLSSFKYLAPLKASLPITTVPSGTIYFSSTLSSGYLINIFLSAEKVTPSITTFWEYNKVLQNIKIKNCNILFIITSHLFG